MNVVVNIDRRSNKIQTVEMYPPADNDRNNNDYSISSTIPMVPALKSGIKNGDEFLYPATEKSSSRTSDKNISDVAATVTTKFAMDSATPLRDKRSFSNFAAKPSTKISGVRDNNSIVCNATTAMDRILHDMGGESTPSMLSSSRRRQNRRRTSYSLLSQLDWVKGQLLILREEESTDHFRMLHMCLMITSILAVCSAYDANYHCVLQATEQNNDYGVFARTAGDGYDDYYIEVVDDDKVAAAAAAEAAAKKVSSSEASISCNQMFYGVMLPVGLITVILSAVSLLSLHRQQQQQRTAEAVAMANTSESPGGGNHSGRSPNTTSDSVSSYLHPVYPCCRRTNNNLLIFATGIFISWTYGIFRVVLQPRQPFDEDGESDAEIYYLDDDSNNNNENPYISLAAVDSYGRVGDNANLYYLSWISEVIGLTLFYQLCLVCVRQYQKPTQQNTNARISAQQLNELPPSINSYDSYNLQEKSFSCASLSPNDSAFLGESFSSFWVEEKHLSSILQYHQNSKSPETRKNSEWFQTYYRLRVRTGFWVFALLSTLVILTSAGHLWMAVLLPAASIAATKQEEQIDDDFLVEIPITNFREVCHLISNDPNSTYATYDTIPEQLCARTCFSLITGIIAAVLCSIAIIVHILARKQGTASAVAALQKAAGVAQQQRQQQPPTSEYLAMGDDASFTSGSSSKLYALNDDLLSHCQEQHNVNHVLPLSSELILSVILSLGLGFNAVFVSGVQGPAARVGNLYYASWISFLLCLRISLGCIEEAYKKYDSSSTNREISGKECEKQNNIAKDPTEMDRSKRLRSNFFLTVFSTICAASALDAACNQEEPLAYTQRLVMWSPIAVALLSLVLFILCLSPESYKCFVSPFWSGGILSILCFMVCLANLVTTMHSEESWAVNGIGEIEMANLYYFTWALILTAGVQMAGHVKKYFNGSDDTANDEVMMVVWLAICKVCFVVFGAGLHVWHTISDNCSLVEIQTYALITFCSRTVFAIIVSVTGMVVGMIVIVTRLLSLRRKSEIISPSLSVAQQKKQQEEQKYMQAHFEAVISIFLVLLFCVAVGLITGIGGPGQSVGDLYYSTWLSFWVSLWIFANCYDQIKLEEDQQKQRNPEDDKIQDQTSRK